MHIFFAPLSWVGEYFVYFNKGKVPPYLAGKILLGGLLCLTILISLL